MNDYYVYGKESNGFWRSFKRGCGFTVGVIVGLIIISVIVGLIFGPWL